MDDLFSSPSAPQSQSPSDLQPRPPDPRPASPVSRPDPKRPPRCLNDDLRDLARLLYSHNPFYCISAVLVLWGLGRSFHMHGAMPRPELLMSGLAGYALLLAAVGCLLIRAGQLWEDIRTILLLIVVIFMAISMSFDQVLATNLQVGRMYFLGGLGFAILLSELVLYGVRLRLPLLYRVPYYGTLALLFLYPLFLGPWQDQDNDPHTRWLLAAFSPLAGLVTLTLLPAIRRGPDYVRNNGSPWQWPWYPWPLFVVLAVGVGLRCYAICVSFHPSRGPATMFEPFMLVPWLFAVNVVLLEIGISTRRPLLVRWMLAAPLALLLLSTWTIDVPQTIGLRPMLLKAIGCAPLFITLMATTVLFAVALLRRVPHAFDWLTASIALLAIIGPGTGSLTGPYALHAWPLAFLALLQAAAAVRYRSGTYSLLAAVSAVAAVCIQWPETIGTRWGGAIPIHALLLAMLLIGALLHDRAARLLQRVAVVGLLTAGTYVMSGEAERCMTLPSAVLAVYPGVMLLLAAAYGLLLRNRWYWIGSLVILVGWILALSGRGYRSLRTSVAGLDQIALGMVCLLAGFLVSLWKLGIPQRWLEWSFGPPDPPAAPANCAAPGNRSDGTND